MAKGKTYTDTNGTGTYGKTNNNSRQGTENLREMRETRETWDTRVTWETPRQGESAQMRNRSLFCEKQHLRQNDHRKKILGRRIVERERVIREWDNVTMRIGTRTDMEFEKGRGTEEWIFVKNESGREKVGRERGHGKGGGNNEKERHGRSGKGTRKRARTKGGGGEIAGEANGTNIGNGSDNIGMGSSTGGEGI
ncbi:MAG: hypothetical protein GY721_12400 [Deltaproteobacteria bacterium]|nr:hypothetical protein [Deltaproteobacteria bacterium]